MVHFFHPRIARITYLFSTKKYEIVLFNSLTFGTINTPNKKIKNLFRWFRSYIGRKPDSETEREIPSEFSEKKIDHLESAQPDYPSLYQAQINSENQQDDGDVSESLEKLGESEVEDREDSFSPERYQTDGIQSKKNIEHPSQELQSKIDDSSSVSENADFTSKSEPQKQKSPRASFFSTLKEKLKQLLTTGRFVWDQKPIGKKIIRWMGRIFSMMFQIIRFDYFSLNLKAGFEDPLLTGTLYGYIISLQHSLALDKLKNFSFRFEPIFLPDDKLFIDGAIRCEISFARLFKPFVVALVTFPYFSTFLLWRKIKKWQKRTQ